MEDKTWKVAWGITGSGDKLEETYEAMLGIREEYDDIEVFLSKAPSPGVMKRQHRVEQVR